MKGTETLHHAIIPTVGNCRTSFESTSIPSYYWHYTTPKNKHPSSFSLLPHPTCPRKMMRRRRRRRRAGAKVCLQFLSSFLLFWRDMAGNGEALPSPSVFCQRGGYDPSLYFFDANQRGFNRPHWFQHQQGGSTPSVQFGSGSGGNLGTRPNSGW